MRAILLAGVVLALAAAPSGLAAQLVLSVANAPPSIESVSLYAEEPRADAQDCPPPDAATTFGPRAGDTTRIHVCVQVADRNGYRDVCEAPAEVIATIELPDDAGPAAPGPERLRCVQGDATAATLIGSLALEHWRAPSSGGAYSLVVEIVDDAGVRADAVSRFDVAVLAAGMAHPCDPASPAAGCAMIVNEGNVPLFARIGAASVFVPVDTPGHGHGVEVSGFSPNEILVLQLA